jgi:hypothetical protein
MSQMEGGLTPARSVFTGAVGARPERDALRRASAARFRGQGHSMDTYQGGPLDELGFLERPRAQHTRSNKRQARPLVGFGVAQARGQDQARST